jgi:O-antigen ligase
MVPARPAVPPRELALTGLILLNVLWLSFALGGVRLWGELTALVLSVCTLLLLPKWGTGEIDSQESPVTRLLKLPLFWCGLGLYAYFFIQSWNLAWEWVVYEGRPVMMSREPRVPWLPTGVVSPMDESNPLRFMIYYTIPWLTCCSAWAGLSTRRSVSWLLHGLALSGVAFAFVALRQHFLELDMILGFFPKVSSKLNAPIPFWGTLVNENHAAFYLILATGLCLGLFLSGLHRDLRLFKHRGGAWLLYLGLAFMTTFAVLMAQARGAIIFVVLQWLLFIAICSLFFIRRFGVKGLALPGVFFAITLAVGINFVVNPEVFERQKTEWTRTFDLVENPELEARYYMMQITGELIREKPWYGHGAGSWRYVHLPLLAKYPEFRTQRIGYKPNEFSGKRERRTITVWFENAHVDLLEYLVEWGIIGCLFPVMAAIWLLYRGLRAPGGWDVGLATILMTVCVVFLGAAVEFHFRIPLVLLVWCLMFILTIRLAELNAGAQ